MHKSAPIPEPRHPVFALTPAEPKADAARLLTAFLPKACRRPIADDEPAPFIALTHRWLDEGATFEEAMRVGYKAILTSPGFLYHSGSLPQNGPTLDAHSLASRLSYFLWNSAPDRRLLDLAKAGHLAKPEALRNQVDRLLDDPRSNRFLEHFLGQWLDLHLIDFTEPDSKLYPEHDKLLQWSMLQETHAFFRELIDQDLGVRNLIDSDFVMANWRLARHYGLPNIDSMAVQRVSLPADSVRGGILTQASVLKVTANGTTTSPVVRGVWVSERIMGQPHRPPPPSVPAIEPDIRGATTVREQLEKHRADTNCAACHAHFDPPGMVLESFDVIGGWREIYRALDPEKADLQIKFSPFQELPIQYTDGLPVDPSDHLPDGRTFASIEEFKQLLLADLDDVTTGLTKKLVTYATGAPVQFADRAEIRRIAERAASKDHGLRTLIHEIVQSRLFQLK